MYQDFILWNHHGWPLSCRKTKPSNWFLLAKYLKNTCGRVTFQVKIQVIDHPQVFFKHFASKNQLPGFYISGILVENELSFNFSSCSLQWLHLVRDGPNVNLRFEKLLNASSEMKYLNTSILSIAAYPFHIVHNGFRAGVNKLNFGLESFTIDVKKGKSSLKSYLTSFRNTPQLDGLPLHLCSHFATTWKSSPVVLIFLLKASNFKATAKETERYKRIKTILESETSIP